MRWLNYHHLLYFYLTAREGGVVPASEVAGVSHPTISNQIKKLETALGQPLFDRRGRRLVLTEMGRQVYGYAEDIFALGQELLDVVEGHPDARSRELAVGITDVVPKLIIRELLEPAYRLEDSVRVSCVEDSHEQLLVKLATHKVDLVLADVPVPAGSRIRAFNHLLGKSPVAILGVPELAAAARDDFPASLDGARMLLPTHGTMMRRELDHWFERNGVRPEVMGQFEDSALLKVFGQDGLGLFPAPDVIADTICRQYHVERVGTLEEVQERFYAITGERRVQHPAVLAICDAARKDLFGA